MSNIDKWIIQHNELTFTGQPKRKCLESWYFSISKSLTPQSLFEAVKWTAPLKLTKQTQLGSLGS